MEIAYSAERSIQDEIEELSKSTTSTIAISYTVMFIYITLSLGKWTKIQDIMVRILLKYKYWHYFRITVIVTLVRNRVFVKAESILLFQFLKY